MATKSARRNDAPPNMPTTTKTTDSLHPNPATPPDTFPNIADAVRAPAGGDTATGGPAPTWQPGMTAQGIGAAGTITHLWSYDAADGVWVYVNGLGWKRLSPASTSGHSHMTILSSIATHANIAVDYQMDASGQIDVLYV